MSPTNDGEAAKGKRVVPPESGIGLIPAQAVEVIADRRSGGISYGSGYQIGPGLVITARHVVMGGDSIRVRFGCRSDPSVFVPATSTWLGIGVDLALLRLDWPGGEPRWPTRLPVLGHLRIALDDRRVPFTAVGFPAHKERRRPGGGRLRDNDHVDGEIPAAANAKTGLLDLQAAGRPLVLGERWKGFSGAAVFAHGLLIGVIVRAEDSGPLIAIRLAVPAGEYRPSFSEYQEPAESIGEFRRLLEAEGLSIRLRPVRRRAAYGAEVERVAARCPQLRDRTTELARLAALRHSDEPYHWWRGRPWAGKTALAARFAADPPADVDIVAFFVSRPLWQRTDQFLDEVCDQLAALLDEDAPRPASPAHFHDLCNRAADQAARHGQHLLILIDGLDENDDRRPIIALLPETLPPHTHVLLLSRHFPDIAADTDPGHPLRDPRRYLRWELSPSPDAQDLEVRANADLKTYLTDPDKTARQVLGLLAAGGALTTAEIATLLQHQGIDLDDGDIQRIVGQAAGRVLEQHVSGAARRYVFAHDTLRETTVERLGPTIDRHRLAIHEWADQYNAAGWPDETPDYLAEGYSTLLVTIDDLPRLLKLQTQERTRFLRRRTGDDHAGLREITLALSQIAAADGEPDLSTAISLAIRRNDLLQPLADYPVPILLTQAALGKLSRAVRLASLIVNPGDRARALAVVAQAAASVGKQKWASALFDAAQLSASQMVDNRRTYSGVLADLSHAAAQARQWERAGAIVAQISDAPGREQALGKLSDAAAEVREWEQAEAFARKMDSPVRRAAAFVDLAHMAVDAGRREQATLLVDNVEATVAQIGSRYNQSSLLAGAAQVVATAGQQERAVRLARAAAAAANQIDEPSNRALAQAEVAQAMAAAGMWDQADAIACQIDNLPFRTGALARVVPAAAALGLWERAELIARQVHDPYRRALALAEIAQAAAEAGQLERVAALFDAAESAADQGDASQEKRDRACEQLAQTAGEARLWKRAAAIARKVASKEDRLEVLVELAGAAAVDGQPSEAVALFRAANAVAKKLRPRRDRSRALAAVAYAAARAGMPKMARVTVHEPEDPGDRARALAEQAIAAAAAGQLQRAVARVDAAEAARHQPSLLPTWGLKEVAQAAAAAGLFDRAEAIVARFDDHDLEGYERSKTLLDVARAAAEAKLVDRAEALAARVGLPWDRPVALSYVARAAAAVGQHERAATLLDAATAAANENNELRHRAEALAEVALAAVDSNDRTRANALLAAAEMTANEVGGAAEDRDRALAAVVKAAAATGQWEHAGSIALNIDDLELRAATLADVSVTAAAAEQRERGLTLFDAAEAVAQEGIPPARADALAHLILRAARTGVPERGVALLDAAEAAARGVHGPRPRAVALAQVAYAAFLVDRKGQGAILLDAAEDSAEKARESSDHDGAKVDIASIAAGAELWERARSIAETIHDLRRRIDSLTDIAEEAVAVAGNRSSIGTLLSAAEAVAGQLPALGDRAVALAKIAYVTAYAGERDRAVALLESAETIADQRRNPVTTALALMHIAVEGANAGQKPWAVILLDAAAAVAGLEPGAQQRIQGVSRTAQIESMREALAATTTDADLYENGWSQQRKRPIPALLVAEIARVAAAVGLWDRAEVIACLLEPESAVQVLADVAGAATAVGQQERAVAIAQRQHSAGDRALVLAKVARTLANAGHRDRAIPLLDAAETALGEAEAALSEKGELHKLSEAAAEVAWGAVAARLWDRADSIAHDLAQYVSAMVLAGAAREAHSAGQQERAGALLDAAKREADSAPSHENQQLYRDLAMAEVASAAAELGLWDQAKAIAQKVEDVGDRAETAATVARIAAAMRQQEQVLELLDFAEATAKQESHQPSRDRALGEIAWAAAAGGLWDRSQSTIALVATSEERAAALVKVTEIAAKAEDRERAISLALRAIQEGRLIIDPDERGSSLAESVQVLVTLDKPTGIRSLVEALSVAFSPEFCGMAVSLDPNLIPGLAELLAGKSIKPDNGGFRHYVEGASAPEAALTQGPIQALCGWIWIPQKFEQACDDLSDLPICPTCEDMHNPISNRQSYD